MSGSLKTISSRDKHWLDLDLQDLLADRAAERLWLLLGPEIVHTVPDDITVIDDEISPDGQSFNQRRLNLDGISGELCLGIHDEDLDESPSKILQDWIWASNLTSEDVMKCIEAHADEQTKYSTAAAESPFHKHYHKIQLIILRWYIARIMSCQQVRISRDIQSAPQLRKPVSKDPIFEEPRSAEETFTRVVSKAALSFAFSFLRRCWRAGEDTELCTELLQDTLDAFKILPAASLFQGNFTTWTEFSSRTSAFLVGVTQGTILNGPQPPICDRNLALSLRLELAIQDGSLSESINMVNFLMRLWHSREEDGLKTAPIMPQLLRYQRLTCQIFDPSAEMVFGEGEKGSSEMFLRSLMLPDSDTGMVPLVDAAVFIWSHLDLLALDNIGKLQSVMEEKDIQSGCSYRVLTRGEPNSDLTDFLEAAEKVVDIQETQKHTFFLLDNGNVYWMEKQGKTPDQPDVENLPTQLEGPWNEVSAISSNVMFSGGGSSSGSCELCVVMSQKSGELFAFDAAAVMPTNTIGCVKLSDPKTVLSAGSVIKFSVGVERVTAITSCHHFVALSFSNGIRVEAQMTTKKFLEPLIDVSSWDHTLVLTASGALYIRDEIGDSTVGFSRVLRTVVPGAVIAGPAVSFFISESRRLYSWSGHNSQLSGQGCSVDLPRPVPGMEGHKVTRVRVSPHSVACVTSEGTCMSWGTLYSYGKGSALKLSTSEPTPFEMLGHSQVKPASNLFLLTDQAIVESSSPERAKIATSVPFVMDLSEATFVNLNHLLDMIFASISGPSCPDEYQECLAIGAVNLLTLQLMVAHKAGVPIETLTRDNQSVLQPLKDKICTLASSVHFLDSIQGAGQNCLKLAWRVLLPTCTERTRLLTQLLSMEQAGENFVFLVDLLVSSLMANDELESCLEDEIQKKRSLQTGAPGIAPSGRKYSESDTDTSTDILALKESQLQSVCDESIIGLARQLIKNLAAVKGPDVEKCLKASYSLPVKLMRLIFSKLLETSTIDPDRTRADTLTEILGEFSWVVVSEGISEIGCSKISAARSVENFEKECELLREKPIVKLLQELILTYSIAVTSRVVPITRTQLRRLRLLLDALSQFNSMSPRRDVDLVSNAVFQEDGGKTRLFGLDKLPVLMEHDIHDHNIVGGYWVVINDRVYDFSDDSNLPKPVSQYLRVPELDLEQSPPPHVLELMRPFLIGRKCSDVRDLTRQSRFVSPLAMLERCVADMMAFGATSIARSDDIVPEFRTLFSAGLVSQAGCAPTSRYISEVVLKSHMLNQEVLDWTPNHQDFVMALAIDGSDTEESKQFMEKVKTLCRREMFCAEFDASHPLEETFRSFIAILLKHCNMAGLARKRSGEELNEKLVPVVKMAVKLKTFLVKEHQESECSYKELCRPYFTKCLFLLNKVRPAYLGNLLLLTQRNTPSCPNRWQLAFWKSRAKAGNEARSDTGCGLKPAELGSPCDEDTLMKQIYDFVTEDGMSLFEYETHVHSRRSSALNRIDNLSFLLEFLDQSDSLPTTTLMALLTGWFRGVTQPDRTSPEDSSSARMPLDPLLQPIITHLIGKLLLWLVSASKGVIRAIKRETSAVKNKMFYLRGLKDSDAVAFALNKYSRLLLQMVGVLDAESRHFSSEQLVESGVIAVMLEILKLVDVGETGDESESGDVGVYFENRPAPRPPAQANMTGPSAIPYLTKGCRVVRGPDWKWDDQDQPHGEGEVMEEVSGAGWVKIKWDGSGGNVNSYRMGKEGKYDLAIPATYLLKIQSAQPAAADQDDLDIDVNKCGHESSDDPSVATSVRLLRDSCSTVIRGLVLRVLSSRDVTESSVAVRSITSLLHDVIRVKVNQEPHPLSSDDTERTLYSRATEKEGVSRLLCAMTMVRLMVESGRFCKVFASSKWVNLLIDAVGKASVPIADKVHCIGLLRMVLPSVEPLVAEESADKLAAMLVYCFSNIPSEESKQGIKVMCGTRGHLITASTAGASATLAELVTSLLRHVHDSSFVWRRLINLKLVSPAIQDCVQFFKQTPPTQPKNTKDIETSEVDQAIKDEALNARTAKILSGLHVLVASEQKHHLGCRVRHLELGECTLVEISATSLMVRRCSDGVTVECTPKDIEKLDDAVVSLSSVAGSEDELASWNELLRIGLASCQIASSISPGNDPDTGVSVRTCSEIRIRLCLMKVLRIIQEDQNLLRKMLAAAPEDGYQEQSSNFRHFLHLATTPSPLKHVFSFQAIQAAVGVTSSILASPLDSSLLKNAVVPELEGADLNDSTLDAMEEFAESLGVYSDASLSSVGGLPTGVRSGKNSTSVRPASPTPTVRQLMEMGFSRQHTEFAVEKLCQASSIEGYQPPVEAIVSWILEHPEPPQSDSGLGASSPTGLSRLNDSSDQGSLTVHADSQLHISTEPPDVVSDEEPSSLSTEPSSTRDNNGPISPSGAQSSISPRGAVGETYLTRSDFVTNGDYALYVRDNIQVGMLVRCCRSFEEVYEGDIGVAVKLDRDGLHDLNVQVDWQEKGGTYWVRYIHVELLGFARMFRIGEQVRVRPAVKEPRYKWGSVTHASVGTVQGFTKKGDVIVNFPQQASWHGLLSELELVTVSNPPRASCPRCRSSNSQTQNRMQVLVTSDQCSCQQSQGRRSPSPSTSRCRSPVTESTMSATLRKSGAGRRPRPGGLMTSSGLVEDWTRCVKKVTVSSGHKLANNLFSAQPDSFWQSSGKQGDHWIQLEMHPEVLINRLLLTCGGDAHSSYQPKTIVVFVGNDPRQMQEARVVTVRETDSLEVLLLADLSYYYRFVRISIRECRNDGIDCRVQSLKITGKLSNQDDDIRSFSFLANQHEDEDEFLDSESGVLTDANSGTLAAGLVPKYKCTVYAWGLNDKGQLGLARNCKIKTPTFNPTISQLNVTQIAGGSKSLFIVTQEGKLYSCGDASHGRLGLKDAVGSVSAPRLVTSLANYVIKKVAVCSGGKHALALTADGRVFSWGDNEDGKLGHNNRVSLDTPQLIEAFWGMRVRDVCCGSGHSAAITSQGLLFTWGLGEYGRLGHGDFHSQLKPKLVRALEGHRVAQVACGSRDAQMLALTSDGLVFSWGDGDFGKLGHGGSESCPTPTLIHSLSHQGVVQVHCGAQFSLALTASGLVYTWGKGDYYRLGHGSDAHVRAPTVVEGLRDKRVTGVAVGALHCLAVTQDGEVFSWGDNDHGQQGSSSSATHNKVPTKVSGMAERISNVACGSSHSLCWAVDNAPLFPAMLEPVRFPLARDPLGLSELGLSIASDSSKPSRQAKPGSFVRSGIFEPPSLTEIFLTLQGESEKLKAVAAAISALQILFSRKMVLAAIQPAKTDEDDDSNLEFTEPGIEQIKSYTTITTSEATSKLQPETITSLDQIVSPFSPSGIMSGGGDSFVESLTTSDANLLIDLLKLVIASRSAGGGGAGGGDAKDAISHVLSTLARGDTRVTESMLDVCVGMLEEMSCGGGRSAALQPVTQESRHPYLDDIHQYGVVTIPGAALLKLTFDPNCCTEPGHDLLTILDGQDHIVDQRSGRVASDWAAEVCVAGDTLHWRFSVSSLSSHKWGWRFTVFPVSSGLSADHQNDRTALSRPSMELVKTLLDLESIQSEDEGVMARLAVTLASCAQMASLGSHHRLWALKTLRRLLKKNEKLKQLVSSVVAGSSVVVPVERKQSKSEKDTSENKTVVQEASVNNDNDDYNSLLSRTRNQPEPVTSQHQAMTSQHQAMTAHASPPVALRSLIQGLPDALRRQFEYEDPLIKEGKHLMHSTYFKELIALTCDIELDLSPLCAESHRWNWLKRFCLALRVSNSLIFRQQPFDPLFLQEVRKKVSEVSPEEELNDFSYEDNSVFTLKHDEQIVHWANRRPEDWLLTVSAGSGTIFGWGHNHRGQLGGVEGSKVKEPTVCDTLTVLRPVQIQGGEQTLFAVTAEGRVYATGYGANGRLGLGHSDSVAVPTLIESLQHVFITKVAINSGGRHGMALSSTGEVFSWGEPDDGKLGHGSPHTACDKPRVIETLRGLIIKDISCGGSHSAAITDNGRLYTWGKGRYGRLGHGDSDDQYRPKVVEALLGHVVVDVACGSGDAQTLCITSDDSVWSWGDGDYGKLGRGGSDGCKVPQRIDTLNGMGIIKVECGSQFSVALSSYGYVYTWGKGDYHRLGHGSDEHVRKPKKIAAFAGKKVIAIATGSLHCIACTSEGEVFTWGDNDEGQQGDGTTNAVQRPRNVLSLQDKNINKISCGSAHSVAWSTNKHPRGSSARSVQVPMEYNLLQQVPASCLRNRLLLLHHFSELFCASIHMLDLSAAQTSSLRGIIFQQGKEAAFKKVVQATMVRDKHHGPVLELNRMLLKKAKPVAPGDSFDTVAAKTVFGQAASAVTSYSQETSLFLPHRAWKVKFIGESVDDCGGGYSESIAEMCEELMESKFLPLLIQTPNGRSEIGANQDCLLLNPSPNLKGSAQYFKFLGILMGIAIRTGSPLSLNIAEVTWKQLAGLPMTIADITEVDKSYIPGLMYIRGEESVEDGEDADDIEALDMPFTTPSVTGNSKPLSSEYTKITRHNRAQYVKRALKFRLHELDDCVSVVREGMARVIPVPLLSLFTGYELETMVCGKPEIPVALLRSVATYKGVSPNSRLVEWFWEVMEELTDRERSLFLRFVWGRTRLPRTTADFRGRDFVIQVLDKFQPPDHFLPESYTCFFLLKLPHYSCKAVLLEKLKYAIHFCKSIDSDDYARIALPADEDDDTAAAVHNDDVTPTGGEGDSRQISPHVNMMEMRPSSISQTELPDGGALDPSDALRMIRNMQRGLLQRRWGTRDSPTSPLEVAADVSDAPEPHRLRALSSPEESSISSSSQSVAEYRLSSLFRQTEMGSRRRRQHSRLSSVEAHITAEVVPAAEQDSAESLHSLLAPRSNINEE